MERRHYEQVKKGWVARRMFREIKGKTIGIEQVIQKSYMITRPKKFGKTLWKKNRS
jgi:hypothetical protein